MVKIFYLKAPGFHIKRSTITRERGKDGWIRSMWYWLNWIDWWQMMAYNLTRPVCCRQILKSKSTKGERERERVHRCRWPSSTSSSPSFDNLFSQIYMRSLFSKHTHTHTPNICLHLHARPFLSFFFLQTLSKKVYNRSTPDAQTKVKLQLTHSSTFGLQQQQQKKSKRANIQSVECNAMNYCHRPIRHTVEFNT